MIATEKDLEKLRTVEQAEEKAWNQEAEARLKEFQVLEEAKRRLTAKALRRATPSEYGTWLKGYMNNGGKVTSTYTYTLPNDFFIAERDFKIVPFYGANSISIIVPKGIKYHSSGLGHCNLYLMDGFKEIGGCVPLYSDIHFDRQWT